MTLKKLVFVFVMIMAVAGLYAAAVPAGEKFVNEKGTQSICRPWLSLNDLLMVR